VGPGKQCEVDKNSGIQKRRKKKWIMKEQIIEVVKETNYLEVILVMSVKWDKQKKIACEEDRLSLQLIEV
jgi:hypothetical protein